MKEIKEILVVIVACILIYLAFKFGGAGSLDLYGGDLRTPIE